MNVQSKYVNQKEIPVPSKVSMFVTAFDIFFVFGLEIEKERNIHLREGVHNQEIGMSVITLTQSRFTLNSSSCETADRGKLLVPASYPPCPSRAGAGLAESCVPRQGGGSAWRALFFLVEPY